MPIIENKLGTTLGNCFDQHELRIAARTSIASEERYLFYTASIHASVANKLTLENRLRHAIEANQVV